MTATLSWLHHDEEISRSMAEANWISFTFNLMKTARYKSPTKEKSTILTVNSLSTFARAGLERPPQNQNPPLATASETFSYKINRWDNKSVDPVDLKLYHHQQHSIAMETFNQKSKMLFLCCLFFFFFQSIMASAFEMRWRKKVAYLCFITFWINQMLIKKF